MSLFTRLWKAGESRPVIGASDLDAVIRLMIVAMYADKSITTEENERIVRLMDRFGMTGDLQQRVKLPTLIAEVRRTMKPGAADTAYVKSIADSISSEDARLLAAGACNDVIRADGTITESEKAILKTVIQALGVR
jgi:uncharacterized tellurite resistance protein B-like protein